MDDSTKKETVLLTGATGLVGRSLVRRLDGRYRLRAWVRARDALFFLVLVLMFNTIS